MRQYAACFAESVARSCSFFGREIAAYDIQTKRCDVYGQDGGHAERVMLIYDGLHYDALAVAGETLCLFPTLLPVD